MEKTLEQRIDELEKKVAALEGLVPEQLTTDQIAKKISNQLQTSLSEFE